jgi:hypothetical protein
MDQLILIALLMLLFITPLAETRAQLYLSPQAYNHENKK